VCVSASRQNTLVGRVTHANTVHASTLALAMATARMARACVLEVTRALTARSRMRVRTTATTPMATVSPTVASANLIFLGHPASQHVPTAARTMEFAARIRPVNVNLVIRELTAL